MRENCTYGSMRGSRRKTAKSVLRVVEDRAGVPDNKGRSALLYTLFVHFARCSMLGEVAASLGAWAETEMVA